MNDFCAISLCGWHFAFTCQVFKTFTEWKTSLILHCKSAYSSDVPLPGELASPWMASKSESWEIFSSLDHSPLVSFNPLSSCWWPFQSPPFLFPMWCTSLFLCLRVATAVLWITATSHPNSKQHTEAQMLTQKHVCQRELSSLGKQQTSACVLRSVCQAHVWLNICSTYTS